MIRKMQEILPLPTQRVPSEGHPFGSGKVFILLSVSEFLADAFATPTRYFVLMPLRLLETSNGREVCRKYAGYGFAPCQDL